MALASGYAVVEKLFLKMKITMATGASEIAEGEDWVFTPGWSLRETQPTPPA